MNRLCLLVLLVCGFALAGKLTVAVSLQPYGSLVREIGGEQVNMVTMLPPGADPHTFEPKPATLKDFAAVSVYFSDGSGIDNAWLPRFKGVNKNVTVVSLAGGIGWMADDDGDSELDPHLWTSPKQMMQVAENVGASLQKLDASNANLYRERTNALIYRLKKLDVELREAIAKLPADRKTFIVFHPAYGYFARDYGMTQLTVEVNGKEPKPKDLARLIKTGKEHRVGIVFVQPQFSKRSAQTIAKELDAKILTTDPLSHDFENNIRELLKALK